ncbi:hypothetical protein HanXRQr2_Chr17g0820541 [Helianthus annuus]|uniref:Uncharacterized protein n=1 Tax=Helianthus annuus TaxID=4232 RepID=A0A9K3DK25_HELAN|nr:hypothetical protein HanXRQr2_Chr17g0820541 [Helianthus annuus]KAJ0814561.1 hypothetical protein HanPSC8_Chr17g0787141 [Helianthus annuus]
MIANLYQTHYAALYALPVTLIFKWIKTLLVLNVRLDVYVFRKQVNVVACFTSSD